MAGEAEKSHPPMQFKGRPPRLNIRKAPLLILLHGQGSNEHSLEFGDTLDDRFWIISLCAPFTQSVGHYSWYHSSYLSGVLTPNFVEVAYSCQQISTFLNEIISTQKVDPSQVYLLGIEQGAVIALNMLLREPERYAACVLINAYFYDELATRKAAPGRFSGLPVLMMQGYQAIFPLGISLKDVSKYVGLLPLKLNYREFRMGQFMTPESLEYLQEWLTDRLDENRVFGLPDLPEYRTTIKAVHLRVRNLERSLQFYVRFMGMNLVERTGNAYAFMTNNDSHHVIVLQNVGSQAQIPPDTYTGMHCVSFEVPDQHSFARAFKNLTENGVDTVVLDQTVRWTMSFKDPDGNGLEIFWDTRHLPGRPHLWQGRDLPLEPEEILSLLQESE
jgi:predicted esterase/catechol 2,3-dioxygenase-like lactoylglutathione lyase family enzyme